MTRAMKERVRELISRVAEEHKVEIVSGVVASDHVHLFTVIPPNVAVSDFVQKAKGRSSRKVPQEFPELKGAEFPQPPDLLCFYLAQPLSSDG